MLYHYISLPECEGTSVTPKSLKKRRVLRGSSGVQSADCRTWTRGALPREFEFSYFVSLPYVVVPIKGPTGRISFGSKARALLSPANARTRRCACGGPPPPAERRVRASLLCHPPLPAPASRAAHPTACAGLCGAQKTVGCPARGRGGRSGSVGPQRHARGVFLLATPPRLSTHGPHSCTWPTLRRTPPSRDAPT